MIAYSLDQSPPLEVRGDADAVEMLVDRMRLYTPLSKTWIRLVQTLFSITIYCSE